MINMKVLAIMQNMWVKNPPAVKKLLANGVDWNYMVRRFLFNGCRTGQRILEVFGKENAYDFIYDESTPEIADNPNTIFKPDPKHIVKSLKTHQPDLVISFGGIANKAVDAILIDLAKVNKIWQKVNHVKCPHPAARQVQSQLQLKIQANHVKELLLCQEKN